MFQARFDLWKWVFVMMLFDRTAALVNLSSSASWKQNATTVAGQADGTAAASPGYLNSNEGIFISDDDTLYIGDAGNNRIVVVQLENTTIVNTFGSGPGSNDSQFDYSPDVFATDTAIYVTDFNNRRVQKWLKNGTNPITRVGSPPISSAYFLFVDKYDTLYVSDFGANIVMGFAPNSSTPTTVAGDSTSGPAQDQLHGPLGIFVDDARTVYVADYSNHRIQKWNSSALLGITVAGQTGTSGSNLAHFNNPKSIVVDTNGYMYIVDCGNNRILRWAPNAAVGVCIIACTNTQGNQVNQLNGPVGLAFDSNGSIYVSDMGNNRVQKFQIHNNASYSVTTAQTKLQPTTPQQTTLESSRFTSELSSTAGITSTISTTQVVPATLLMTSTSHIVPSASTQSTLIESTTVIQITTMNPTNTVPSITTSSMLSTVNHVDTSTPTISTSWTTKTTSIKLLSTEQTGITTQTTIYSSTVFTSIMSTSTSSSTVDQSSIISTSTLLQMSTTTTTQLVIGNCFSAVIALSPYHPFVTSSMQIERSQDFSISSSLNLQCSKSLAIITQWTIKTCLNSRCLVQEQFDQIRPTMTLGELFIPARTFKYGVYEMQLAVTMLAAPKLISTAITYVEVISSPITVRLVQFGATMIRRGQQEIVKLDPGTFSLDPDEFNFDSNKWYYTYFCRVYGVSDFPSLNGTMLAIDDPQINLFNTSCFDNQTLWQYGSNTSRSSLIVLGGSLTSNQTYHFKVKLTNVLNSALIFTNDLLVQIEDSNSSMIVVTCVIPNLCIPKNEFQTITPTTHVALMSQCMDNCNNLSSNAFIEWMIYYGSINLTTGIVEWFIFDNMTDYKNVWFFGMNSNHFTATKDLFVNYSSIQYWRFEVVYSVGSLRSGVGMINFFVDTSPQNGTCSTNFLNGTTTTLFTITCTDWFDSDGIKDYSFYTWTTVQSNRLMLGYSTSTNFQVRMPMGDVDSTILHLVVRVRDVFDRTTEWDMPSISVIPDTNNITILMTAIQSVSQHPNNNSGLTSNPFIQILYGGNQNAVCQLITSFSQVLNMMAEQNLQTALASNIAPSSISVSSLHQENSMLSNRSWISYNISALIEYNHQLNTLAITRDYLMMFINNLNIAKIDSIVLQATTIAQLTATSNQLTRDALTIASTKCNQLANSLFSIAQSITAEDVQTAASQIGQCISSCLTAVSTSLQHRTTPLDLDMVRSNTLPVDYDADPESVWSNPYLFASGDDFSSETIQQNRNFCYQQQTADVITAQFEETMTMITKALLVHLNAEQCFIMNTSSLIISLQKTTVNTLFNQLIRLKNSTEIRLPSNIQLNLTSNSTVALRVILTPLALRGGQTPVNTNLSTLLSITIFDQNDNKMAVHTSVEQPIEFFIPRGANFVAPPMTLQNVTTTINDSSINNRQFNLHSIAITRPNNNISVSIHFEIRPLDINLGYMLIYKFDGIPLLNRSINQIDGWSSLCPANLTSDDLLTYFIDNQRTTNHRSIIFGIRQLNETEFAMHCLDISTNLSITDQSFNFSANYEVRAYLCGCYYLDSNNQWQSDGLLVGPLTNHLRTQCYSRHLSTFAGGFLVLPAPINWNYVFANADFAKNKTIYLTVIVITVAYLVLTIYARHKDQRDVEKLCVTPLPDNRPTDKYFYQILVFTGMRTNAGTTSKVQFVLSGDNEETGVRTLTDPDRKIFQRGSIDSFIAAVPKSLGPLNYIRIWHDNSGRDSSSSWFLKYIIVRDLQIMTKSYFICQKWLAVEKDDGAIERLLPVASDLEKRKMVYLLSKKAYHSFSDDHLWFSIFSRPFSSTFTRVQRCTCCFVLLFTVMLLNILYYDQAREASSKKTSSALSLGPFYFSREQIGIGLIVDILMFIPSTFLVVFFRRIRRRRAQHKVSPVFQALFKLRPIQRSSSGVEKKKKKRSFSFPWWCLFIAYGLSFILIILAMFLIIARGIEFGDVTIQKWLASLATGFFSSVLLSQPIKVLCFAAFFTFVNRRTDNDEEAAGFIDAGEDLCLNDGHKHLHSLQDNAFTPEQHCIQANRLNKTEVAEAREIRLREVRIRSFIQEVLTYVFFLVILYAVSYANRDENAYHQVHHLRNYFLNSHKSSHDYMKISTINEYWQWLEESFLSNIRAQPWYNGEQPQYLSGFINDKSSRLIGWPIMRQLRIRSNSSCRVPIPMRQIIRSCKAEYNQADEDYQSWAQEWMSTNNISYSSSIHDAFLYRSGAQFDSYAYVGEHATYGSGGYVYEFRGGLDDLKENLSILHELSWIDQQSRAVIIQFTLYNPNTQLYTSVTLLVELLATGGVFPQARFEPVYLYDQFRGFPSLLHAICAIIYTIFIVYLTILEIPSMIQLQKSYFPSIWSVIEWGIIGCSWAGFGIYVWRFHESLRLGTLFRETHGFQYVNLQLIVYVNNVFTFLLGFCCFFSTLRVIHLCRFNSRFSQMNNTLQYASKDLLYFTLMFSIVLFSFIILFHLLFASKVWSCSNVLNTVELLFQILIFKFDSHELQNADTFLGPFTIAIFLYFVVFICCTTFVSIINKAYRCVRQDIRQKPIDGQQVFLFILLRIRRLIGMGKRHRDALHENGDEQINVQRQDPVLPYTEQNTSLPVAVNQHFTTHSKPPQTTTAPNPFINDCFVESVSTDSDDDK